MADAIDPREFRDVMGRFATGVTVVTVAVDGELRGMTANAFSSLSLDPALLLVCVDKRASLYQKIEDESVTAFGVNILASDQVALSQIFATRGVKDEVMAGQPFHLGPLGSPILDGVLAWTECEVEQTYEGGDHLIVVGRARALQIARPEAEPLIFYTGQYHALGDMTPRPSV